MDSLRPGLARTWGDGGGDTRPHVIEFMSIADGRVGCRCGTMVLLGDHLSLEVAWEIHRGHRDARPTVYELGALASDDEVDDFLANVADPEYVPPSLQATNSYTREATGLTADAVAEAFDWLARVKEMQSFCTCILTGVRRCPNYREGDEQHDSN